MRIVVLPILPNLIPPIILLDGKFIFIIIIIELELDSLSTHYKFRIVCKVSCDEVLEL